MPTAPKPGSLKDPEVAALFSAEDPETRFSDLREIGHGSFGAVYFAFDKVSRECVAIKKMSYSGKQSAEKWCDIVKEVRFLKQLRHKNVVEFKSCFNKDHTCWLAMEYCVGSASDILEVHRKPLREQEIAAMCHEVLQGLQYIHSLGRIHRDIKAGNILLTDIGSVKLADFGSASLISPAQSFVGTPYWMAPEVILAMDEGKYDQKADVWSLGITCIELAEKKPPLFNMNAMSALYHIAQNDSPSLSSSMWSDDFHSFVGHCLIKDPVCRFSTDECLKHPFIKRPRTASIIYDLIQRTKTLVRDLDHYQYRKMRKLMYLDEQQSGSSAEVSSLDGEDVESVDDDLCGETASSRSDSLTSMQSLRSGGSVPPALRNSITSVSSLKKAQMAGMLGMVGDSSRSTSPSQLPTCDSGLLTGADVSQTNDASKQETSGNPKQAKEEGPQRKEEILASRRSRFATIRPTGIVAREQTEYAAENNVHEQMSGYKRMRREHQKELRQLEEKSKAEMESLKLKLDKEYDSLLAQFHKELDKLHQTHRQELDKRVKTNEELERKLRKSILQQQEVELKALQVQFKKEYKVNKERLKQEMKLDHSPRNVVEGSLRSSKQNHLHIQAEAENRMLSDHKFYLDFEVRKLKRRRLLYYHQLEMDLLREEMASRGRQLHNTHSLLRRQHEVTQDLEMKHLQSFHNLRVQHLQRQHSSELQNQQAYMKRVQDELRKKHATQVKQQPKELKQKELQIRRQFRQAVKTQTRQYKVLQLQLTQELPREGQRDVIARLKEEQKRKLALLAEQYEGSIGEVMENQTVKLETWQEEEAKQTKEKLNQELELLMAYQSKQRMQMDQQHEREKSRLQEKVSLRCAVLEQKMEEELAQFDRERLERTKQLEVRQTRELDVFDEESDRLGFAHIALACQPSATRSSMDGTNHDTSGAEEETNNLPSSSSTASNLKTSNAPCSP
uniref:non-specific serine/threonine protein kinase n=1 Tax=Trichuris muris TaxID=70415 RepID=A0A5S6QQ87_TRIMR